jgi:hypothetical protein
MSGLINPESAPVSGSIVIPADVTVYELYCIMLEFYQ